MIRSIIYFLTAQNTQNELPLGRLLNNHHNGLPVEGCQHPPNGGSSEMHDWGDVHNITGVHGLPQGGCRKIPAYYSTSLLSS